MAKLYKFQSCSRIAKPPRMKYYLYRTPGQPLRGTLNTTEPPESILQRFRFGEYNLTEVTEFEYWAEVRFNFAQLNRRA